MYVVLLPAKEKNGPNFFNKKKFGTLLKFDYYKHPKNDKLLKIVTIFITEYAVFYNVTFRRVRAFIIAVGKECNLLIVNARL